MNKNNKFNPKDKEDLTGRSRIIINVISSWGAYLVFVIAGFLMPRLIDEHVGQASLGVWDFCWSIVVYLEFAGLGVGSSVNRYVAKYRAVGDTLSLGIAVSSVILIQVIVALFVALITLSLVIFIPDYFSEKFGADVENATWVVGLLGLSVVFRMLFDPARGVVTGCHRWDVHNGIQSVSHVVSTGAMIAALVFDGGLVGMALAYAVVALFTEVFRAGWAFRVCSELVLKIGYVRWSQIKKMIRFGVKTIIASAPVILLTQTTIILLVGSLGPAALAVFARPLALVRHVHTFVSKFAFVLTPTAGSLDSTGRREELGEFFLLTLQYGVAITLPMILVLTIYGDLILDVWMGEDYVRWDVIVILSVGYFLPISQGPALRILMGMNMHGKIGIYSFVVMLVVYLAGLLIIGDDGWSLVSASILLVTPLIIGNGIMLPLYACRKFEISLFDYIKRVFLVPVLCCSVYAACLFFARYFFPENLFWGVGLGLLGGGIVLMYLYWMYLLSSETRKKLFLTIQKKALRRFV